MRLGRLVLALAAGIAALGSAPPAGATQCTGDPNTILDAAAVVPGAPAGRYAVPADTPDQLVVFAHGYTNSSASWEAHLKEAAGKGAIAVAMDYTGLGPGPGYRGWPADAGSTDLIAAGRFFQQECSIQDVFLLGVSMGGNMSGLAVAKQPTRVDQPTVPLFDYWIDVEGVTNLVETYAEATAAGLFLPFAQNAADDIKAETSGGDPAELLERTVVARAPDVEASGVKGVIVVHGVDDGLVPYDQSREMAAALRVLGVPTDVFTILRRTDAEEPPGHEQTTLTGTVFDALGQRDPFAGHAWEGSTVHTVMRTALDRLYALMIDPSVAPADREFLVDAGVTYPVI